MELKEGYKQTEAGVIPDDWDICELREAVDFLDSQRRPIKSSEREKLRGEYPYYGASGVVDYVNNYLFDEELILLGEDGENILSRSLPLAFKVSGKIWVNNHAHVLRPKTDFNIGYLTEFLESRDYTLLNSGTAQPKLNKHACSGLKILKPTKTEQTAIAEALNDMDALITHLEKLIAKKCQIKQGAMQTLLNPFNEKGELKDGWEETPLKEISYMKGRIGWQGLKQSEFTDNNEEPFLITGMNFKDGKIRWNEVYHISEERFEIAKDIQLKIEDVLMTKDGTIGKLLYVDSIPYPGKASLNSHLLLFRPIGKSYAPKFLYYQLMSKSFKEHIEISKSGTTFFGLSQGAVGKYLFKHPSYTKQEEIANAFTTMDDELDQLRLKLNKTQKFKQGMMQSLLTGKIRLVKPQGIKA